MFNVFLDRRIIMYTDQRTSDNMQFCAVKERKKSVSESVFLVMKTEKNSQSTFRKYTFKRHVNFLLIETEGLS